MGAPWRAAARPGRGLSSVSVASQRGGRSDRTVSEVREEQVPRAPRGTGAVPERGAAAGQGRLRWITSCVEERGLGEGTEVCDGAWGQLAQRLLVQYQCNEPFACRNYNSPSSRPKPTNKTSGKECGGCQAWRGAAKANLHAFPPTLVGKQLAD